MGPRPVQSAWKTVAFGHQLMPWPSLSLALAVGRGTSSHCCGHSRAIGAALPKVRYLVTLLLRNQAGPSAVEEHRTVTLRPCASCKRTTILSVVKIQDLRDQKFGNKSKYASRRFVRSLRDLEIQMRCANINKQLP